MMVNHFGTLSATVSEMSLSKNTIFKSVLNAILEGKTPEFADIQKLGKVPTAGRRKQMRAELEAFAGKGLIVENTTIDMVAGHGDLGRVHAPKALDDRINEIFENHRLPTYTPAFPDNIYQSLDCALRMVGTADFVAPKYVMATQEELAVARTKAAADAYFTAHPDVTLVLKASSGDGLHLGEDHIPASLRKLSIVGDYSGTHLLYDCRGLTTLSIDLPNVTHIGNYFLSGCGGLTTLSINLPNVTHIGNYFLQDCNRLETIDLSSLSNVIEIGSGFLQDCNRLETIDLSPLRKVTTIEYGFMSYWTKLKALDLSPLSNVIQIGDDFLVGSDNLDAPTQRAVKAFKTAVAARAAAAGRRPAGAAAGVSAH